MDKKQLYQKVEARYNEIKSEFPNFELTLPKCSEFSDFYLKEYAHSLEQFYDKTVAEHERNKYFETEEGKQLKEDLEHSYGELETERVYNMEKCKEIIVEMILSKLGKNFKCDFFYNSFSVYLIDSNGHPVFGHVFDVTINSWSNNRELKVNYGGMESFDPLTDKNRIEFLNGRSSFVSDTELIENIEKIYLDWADENTEIERKQAAINKKLLNPLNR
jgi:hypothetical protein